MKKAIILAAGKGTRMKSIHPKVVHQVCGKAMVNHVIDAARSAGVGETVVVLGHGIDEVRRGCENSCTGRAARNRSCCYDG